MTNEVSDGLFRQGIFSRPGEVCNSKLKRNFHMSPKFPLNIQSRSIPCLLCHKQAYDYTDHVIENKEADLHCSFVNPIRQGRPQGEGEGPPPPETEKNCCRKMVLFSRAV